MWNMGRGGSGSGLDGGRVVVNKERMGGSGKEVNAGDVGGGEGTGGSKRGRVWCRGVEEAGGRGMGRELGRIIERMWGLGRGLGAEGDKGAEGVGSKRME